MRVISLLRGIKMKRTIVLLVLLILLPGCGKEKIEISTHKVSGRVLYNNEAAEGVSVYLGPIEAPGVPDIPSNPHGITDKQGRFTISTYSEDDGAPIGKYQLMMIWVDYGSKRESNTDRFFGWYDAANSTIMVRILAGENKIPDIKVPVITRPPEPANGIVGRN